MKELGFENEQHAKFEDNEVVCYCFTYTKKDIESDFLSNGYSTILAKIQADKKANICSCEEKNPKKR